MQEPESARIRELVRQADYIQSSIWAFAEFHAVLVRHMRENELTGVEARDLASRFAHVSDGLWNLIPVAEALLRRTSLLLLSAPRDIFSPRCGRGSSGNSAGGGRYRSLN
jgi:hypothetical protein